MKGNLVKDLKSFFKGIAQAVLEFDANKRIGVINTIKRGHLRIENLELP